MCYNFLEGGFMEDKVRYMTIREYVDDVVKKYEEDSFMFCKSSFTIINDKGYSLAIIEKMLRWRIPNIIITHSDTDNEEDIKKQIDRINYLLDNNIGPYFVDFSQIETDKVYLKKKDKKIEDKLKIFD